MLEPWVTPFLQFIYAQMWGLGSATGRSACLVLCHSESGPLGFSVRECGAAGSASGQTACPVCPTLRQSWSRHSHSSPLHPGCRSPPLLPVWMNVYFLSPWCRTSLPSIFCQFLLCEEAQCVYLCCHLGYPLCDFLTIYLHGSGRSGQGKMHSTWSVLGHSTSTLNQTMAQALCSKYGHGSQQ